MLTNRTKTSPARKTAEQAARKGKVSAIGTQKESSLHRTLKFRYSGSGGSTETSVAGYVCDGKTSKGEIIEVQIGSFAPLKEKARRLAEIGKVRIIHPIIVEKFIELYDAEGGLLHRRKSPRKGCEWDLFKALVYAPELCLLKNLTIELALIDMAEKRINDGKGSWRRKGVRIDDKSLAAWRDSIILKKPKDYRRFIPFEENDSFTTRRMGEKAGINAILARKTLYVLEKIGLVERIGKEGNAIVFRRK